TGATFTHNRFPLTGPHSALPCESCHAPPNNVLIFPVPSSANDCVACHRADYDREHTGSNFPTACTSCHSGNSWTGATFNHVQFGNGYALVGVHGTLQCSACHGANNQPLFNPTSNQDCIACHQADYNAEHSGSGYPTTCTTCHTQTTWGAASFDHDAQFFPIYSGKHQGKWSTCTQCHPTPTNLAVFTCLSCHTKTKTDNDHSGVSGYAYDSARCLACHPRGD
ncbi:MAG TPA: hypothetical protein VK864_16775, partial [Longimicrobiales bacterium]|nr:hypothetical protein [Longimicrobiales bacterium]